jgi:hypothetical protein
MLGLAIEIRAQCGSCGQPLPLNAFAERVTCAGCHRENAFDGERWKGLLEDALEELPGLAEDEGKNQTIMTAGTTFAIMYGRQQPRCSSCKTQVPVEATELAPRGWIMCVGCGKRMSIRLAPPAAAALGMKFLVAEDTAQVGGSAPGTPTVSAPAKAANPVAFYCPNCKGALSVDGSKRMVTCQYCSTDVYLPDELWQRLHPVAQAARWYAWLPEVDLAARRLAQLKWSTLGDAVIDAQNNIYCSGEEDSSAFDDKFIVWCMGPDLQVRWIRDGLDYSDSDARLALDPGGRLLVWQNGKHSATVLATADGAVLGKLGGKEPDGATEHHFDLDHCKQLCFDVDGTIIALIGERLVRYTADGHAAPTWPPRTGVFAKKEKPAPLYRAGHHLIDVQGEDIEVVGHHPTAIDDYSMICVGWDGRFYAEYREWVACFDRQGNRLYRLKLPVDDDRGHRIGADAAGHLYVLTRQQADPEVRQLVRVAPDGSRVDVIATDHRAGGVLGDEERIVVATGGQILLLGYGKAVRMLAPDGRLLYMSDKSREEDKDELEELAKKA